MMMINRRRVCGGKSLPYDAEIEYLESRNGAYIDTQVTAKHQTNIEIKLRFTGDVEQTAIPYGFYYLHKLSNRFYYRPASNSYVYVFHNATTFNLLNMRSDSLWHTIQTDVNQFIIDSLSFQSSSSSYTGTTTCKFLLFGQDVSNNGNTHSFSGTSDTSFVDIAYAKIFDGDTLIHDFIPVRVGQVGYMYDKVSGTLFGNAGTGDFILGPDV